jgi:hypothetical protein
MRDHFRGQCRKGMAVAGLVFGQAGKNRFTPARDRCRRRHSDAGQSMIFFVLPWCVINEHLPRMATALRTRFGGWWRQCCEVGALLPLLPSRRRDRTTMIVNNSLVIEPAVAMAHMKRDNAGSVAAALARLRTYCAFLAAAPSGTGLAASGWKALPI